jgi:hypothetical protein
MRQSTKAGTGIQTFWAKKDDEHLKNGAAGYGTGN